MWHDLISKRSFLIGCVSAVLCGTVHSAPDTKAAAPKKRIAVVFVSKTGNTKSLAESIAAYTGADLFEVQTLEPYPQAYDEATEVVKAEMEQNVVRPIKPVRMDPKAYDAVVLLTPTWWHHVARPLQTWMESVDLSGMFIITGNTHGGGGLMHTREDFEKLLPKSRLGTHFTVYASVRKTNSRVRRWLEENELI